jgi:hypothetical protein
MLKFKSFLKEEVLNEELLVEAAETASLEADDKGKMHELLLAKHLHPNSTLPEHHRSFSDNEDHAGTPQQVHDRLRKKIGEPAYAEIDRHAKQSADAFKEHLKQQGHIGDHAHIGNVHWTSNADKPNVAGDHEKTVGVKDVNSNADVILTLHDKEGKTVGHHGISAKYGSQEPNYRNPGMDALEKAAKIPSGSLSSFMNAHKEHMDKLGYSGSADQRNIQTKIDEMGVDKARAEHAKHEATIAGGKKLSGKNKVMHEQLSEFLRVHDSLPKSKQELFVHKAKARADMARSSNLSARTSATAAFAQGLSQHDDASLRDVIRQNVSPSTHIPHSVVHSKVKNDGSAESVVKPMHSLADDHLSNFEEGSLHVAPGAGTTVTIKGKHAKTGKIMTAARYTLKSSSGAHKGIAGSFKLK